MICCPLCTEDGDEREAEQDYDGVKLCVYHALAAQTNEEDVRARVAAVKESEAPVVAPAAGPVQSARAAAFTAGAEWALTLMHGWHTEAEAAIKGAIAEVASEQGEPT